MADRNKPEELCNLIQMIQIRAPSIVEKILLFLRIEEAKHPDRIAIKKELRELVRVDRKIRRTAILILSGFEYERNLRPSLIKVMKELRKAIQITRKRKLEEEVLDNMI